MRIFYAILVVMLVSCNSITERLDNYEVHGIDISHHQATIDWDLVAQQGIDFAFIKATEGRDFRDRQFCTNWKEIQRVGIRRGAYHFFRPKTSAYLQVENFVEQVELAEGDLPPVLDIEVEDGVSKEDLLEGVNTWLLLAEAEFKVRPIIYSNYKFYLKYLADEFPDYPVWIARYGFFHPHLGNNREWCFWQYGDQGRVEGIKGNVDLNVFKGSLQDLEKMCSPSPMPNWTAL